jgi:4-hydroxy-tetrahydrodipicolinate synthase
MVKNDQFVARGVMPALVTPFAADEAVDEAALRALVRHVLPHVNGVVPCGTTGEFVYLTPDEQRRIIEIVVDEVAGRVPVVAGTGAASTRLAVQLAQQAQQAGASACLVVTPFFLHPSDKGIYQHFYEIAQAVDIPIILYNIPQVVDAYLPRTVVEDLADIPNIVALKDSSGNLTYTMEVLEMTRGRLDVLIGHDEVVLPALAGGCSGMILASAQVFPEVWQQVYAAVQAGEMEKARELQMSVQKLARIFCRYGGGVPVKVALNMMGVKVGGPRRPLMKQGGVLINEVAAEIRLELEKLSTLYPLFGVSTLYPLFGVGKVATPEVSIEIPQQPLAQRFADIGLSPEALQSDGVRLGSATSGEGVEQVHVDLVAGFKGGPVGEAYALQLTYPRQGHEALTAILEPNLMVRPAALIVPTVALKNLRQANMVYGPTQAAVGKAIVDGLAEQWVPQAAMEDEVILAQVTIHPQALDRHELYWNAYGAMSAALKDAYPVSQASMRDGVSNQQARDEGVRR